MANMADIKPSDVKVEFTGKTQVTVKEAVVKDFTSLTIDRIIDYPSEGRLSVLIRELGNITITEGISYQLMGDWTRNEIYDLIKLKFSGEKPIRYATGDTITMPK
jgi:hypothetical protein